VLTRKPGTALRQTANRPPCLVNGCARAQNVGGAQPAGIAVALLSRKIKEFLFSTVGGSRRFIDCQGAKGVVFATRNAMTRC
jgi:hypothetical protein